MIDRARLETRELARLWQAVLGRLELELNRHNFATWLAGTRALSFDGSLLSVEARSSMASDWLDKRMRVVIERAASQVFGCAVSASFVVVGERAEDSRSNPEEPASAATMGVSIGNVNCAYTFEEYLASSGNQLALDACRSVLEVCDAVASPVVLYGSPGMGKTHLLHALACSVKASGRSVACLSAEEFANRFLGSLRSRLTSDFQDQLRAVDVLIIDDLQAIAGKRATQDELVCTMDAVCNRGGYVVVASEKHPFELGLPERLESRLAAGIITRVQPFDRGERRAFIEHIARQKRIALPAWAVDRLAAVNAPSVRVLLGCVNAAVALERSSRLEPGSLDSSLGAVAILEHGGASSEDELLQRVARHFGFAVEMLVGRARNPRLTEARAVAAAGLQQRGYTLPRISAVFSGRDKSTISELAGKGRALLEEQELLRHLVAS